jgi:hypothetical protein
MRISEPIGQPAARAALLVTLMAAGQMAFALCAAGAALALDVKEGPPAPVEKGTMFKSVGDSLRAGLRALSSGDPGSAVEPLTFAAREGNDIAEWKLGRMYAEGEGVPRDPYKAYVHFSQIVNRRADLAPDSPNARIVAQAFVALGGYHLTGIPNSRIRREPARAAEMFHYAASYYNDADAQYELGRMLAEGSAGEKNLQQAARWFNLAAEQGHVHAQARLGHLLFNGEGVPRQAPRGLMWMKIATASADPDRDSWVLELNRRAQAVATDDERRLADAFAKKRERNSR